ncbi:MAG TPA: glycosyltransferase family protein [Vicinamibacterales bacterium]|nr:glycosyltransferase family protein [Vicinamibacterales bacterium]
MKVCFYISGHGFGHASRDIELIHALRRRIPDIHVAIRTSAPRWLFDDLGAVDVQTVAVDTGMTQIDSLRIDEDETARQAAAFYADFDRRVAAEADVLRRLRADAVVADIPPLAFAAAAAADVPSIAVANFTWDWIYGAYESFARLAPDAIGVIRRAYAQTTLALRLPLHGGFEPMAAVTRDVPLIARASTRDRDDTRRLLALPAGRPIVLPSFGGYSVTLPWDRLLQSTRFTVIRDDSSILARRGLRYPDLVAAADVVVSKPGYGIVSECISNRTSLLYTSRGRFAEQDVFVAEMPRLLRCRPIDRQQLLSGHWDDAIEALLRQAPQAERPRTDGADVAAETIFRFLDR